MATEIDIAVTTTTYDVTITASPNEYIVNITTNAGGGIESVTGLTVDNTDPLNPVVGVPNLTQVLTQGDLTYLFTAIIDSIVTIPSDWALTENYIESQNFAAGGELFLDNSIIFQQDCTIRFQHGYTSESDITVSLNAFPLTTDSVLYYQGAPITSITINPEDYCMLKFIGRSADINYWILTVTNKSTSSGGGTWGSITGTLSTQTDLQTALNAKENITSATTGAVISFATPQIYNSIASPSSSNLTDNLTGARIGVVQKIYHNAGTAPTVPAGWVLRGTGAYVTSTLNIIYAEWSVGTTVEYWITQ